MEHNKATYYIGGSKFNLIYDDITQVPSDAIVSSDDEMITMGGGVSATIRRNGGPYIQEDAQKHTDLSLGDVVVSSAGTLQMKYVFHAITINYQKEEFLDEEALKSIMDNVLSLSKALKIKRISLPAIGTGAARFSFTEAVKIITQSIASFLQQNECIEAFNLCLLKDDDVTKEKVNELFEESVSYFSISQQNNTIKNLLVEANESLKVQEKVDVALVKKLEDGFARIDEIEQAKGNVILPNSIPNLLEDLGFLHELLHSVNTNKHRIEQLKEDKNVLEQKMNYQRTALRHYELEKAKYGGEMVPFRLLMQIEDVEKEIDMTEKSINENNEELKSYIEVARLK
ncbi:hypothetical protein EI427_21815 [Flammeovirga pectinis]|uniref:Macro domain-containing protein n=1 Tax=Flammeovirga pectinis TaxID=2494373 RepID=A0A3Q9FUS0_9BACT|nr:macro domain-containing protein [Flammeovirga pectinis]AZQ64865.1 hypothetical protein EI427_21815 [Flammeovirga pectinis]